MRWQHASDLRRAERGIKSDRAEPANGNVWPIAVYWTFLEVGTPPVRFPVSIDSGSYTLDLPLAGCNGCVHQAPNTDYNPAQSNTSHLISCNEGCPGGSECKNGVCSFSNTYETCVPCKGLDWFTSLLFPSSFSESNDSVYHLWSHVHRLSVVAKQRSCPECGPGCHFFPDKEF
jgi:hypothetical protein